MFGLIILIFIIKCIAEACEPQVPASYHRNMKLEAEDSWKVSTGELSKRQFLKNIENGKYR